MAIALLRTQVNPFDLKTVLLAKQRATCGTHPFSDRAVYCGNSLRPYSALDEATRPGGRTYYNLLTAAISTLPVLVTGILAWQYQLDGQKLKGILLLHLILACVSSGMIWLVWWVNFRARRRAEALPSYRLAIEFLAVGIVALTGHLGGFLSGVNGPG